MANLLDYAITSPVNPRADSWGSGHAVGERRPDTDPVTIPATARQAAAELAWRRRRPGVAGGAVGARGPAGGAPFLPRAALAPHAAHEPLAALYGDAADELL